MNKITQCPQKQLSNNGQLISALRETKVVLAGHLFAYITVRSLVSWSEYKARGPDEDAGASPADKCDRCLACHSECVLVGLGCRSILWDNCPLPSRESGEGRLSLLCGRMNVRVIAGSAASPSVVTMPVLPVRVSSVAESSGSRL